MIRTLFRRRAFSHRVVWALCLSALLILNDSRLGAQTILRPPSRALPGAAKLYPPTTAAVEESYEEVPRLDFEEIPRLDFAAPLEPAVIPASHEVFPEIDVHCYERVICRPVWEVPNMFGDFIGTGVEPLTIRGNQLLNAAPGEVIDPATLGTGSLNSFSLLSPAGSVVGRQKAANNNSPLPRDRVFLDYNYISNAISVDGGVGLHRFTPGLERTFLDNTLSLEVRVPMAITFDSDSIITGSSSRDQAELGNVYLALKGVLWSSDEILISTGLGSSLPTADNLRFFNANRRELLRVENEAFHLLPYLAGVWSDGGFFFQGFLQGDVDINGNAVLIDNGARLQRAGDFHDASFLYLDLGTGYWLIRDRHEGWITGIAPTVELHYNTALTSADGARSVSGIQLGEEDRRPEWANVVLGATFQLAGRNTLAVGWTTAIGGDEQFNDGLQVLLNWYYGGPN